MNTARYGERITNTVYHHGDHDDHIRTTHRIREEVREPVPAPPVVAAPVVVTPIVSRPVVRTHTIEVPTHIIHEHHVPVTTYREGTQVVHEHTTREVMKEKPGMRSRIETYLEPVEVMKTRKVMKEVEEPYTETVMQQKQREIMEPFTELVKEHEPVVTERVIKTLEPHTDMATVRTVEHLHG